MKAFLRQVAEHYFKQGGLEGKMFIFPNRRSLAFFRKHLCDLCAEAGKVTLLPLMTTVSDFYATAAGMKTADRISLLVRLYDCYKQLNPKAESLDDFIYWGDVLLADFNDIDRYLVDAQKLFSNIRDLKSIQDDYSYTTPEQKAAIERLAGHFTPEKWKVKGPVQSGPDVKTSFLQVWQILYPLYTSFRESLLSDGLAYDGMVYRSVAEHMKQGTAADVLSAAWPDTQKFVFVGLNVLSQSEIEAMRKMRDAGLADFCWDFSGPMLTDPSNIASHIMAENVIQFPDAVGANGGEDNSPVVNVCSVASATGQAKLLPGILDQIPEAERGLDFAVVLADEGMLSTVLGSVPQSVDSVNVTMGYPLASSEWVALMKDVVALQMNIRDKNGKKFFYHRQVTDILSSGIIKGVLDENETDRAAKILETPRYYIPVEAFAAPSGIIPTIFCVAGSLAEYLMSVTDAVAGAMGEESSLQKEFAMQYYCCVNRLNGLKLDVQPRTWLHLLDQIVSGVSVPFEGEPLGGMQIMGPLETRALDFKHIVIMNAGEGSFPRRSASSSFIPPELRAAFGLPTYERQDAVWAYYFYRLISRAQNVWMLYDSRSEGLLTGEESRYIKQLRYIYPDKCNLREYVAQAEVHSSVDDNAIDKTQEDINTIQKATFSASSISKYLSCPVQFYYYVVKKLRPEDEVKESLDPGLMGTVCHDTLQALYTGEEAMASDSDFDKRDAEKDDVWRPYTLSLSYLESWTKREDEIRRKVNSLICQKLHCLEVSGRDLVTAEIAVRFVKQVVLADVKLLKDRHLGELKIYGLEHPCSATICGHKFFGYLDRVDSLEPGTVRVVDYKTGSDSPDVLAPETTVSKVFGNDAHRYKAALQFFIYDRFLASDPEFEGLAIKNSMYAMSEVHSTKVDIYDDRPDFDSGMEVQLKDLFGTMENPAEAFVRVDQNDSACKYCDYKALCGRCPKID